MGTRLAVMTLVAVAAATLVSCSEPSEPSDMGRWEQRWDAAQQTVPEQTELGDSPDQQRCASVLADLREARVDLPPAPDEIVESAATEWIDYAESVFFGCFESVTVTDAYAQLERLRQEVETATRSLETSKEVVEGS